MVKTEKNSIKLILDQHQLTHDGNHPIHHVKRICIALPNFCQHRQSWV